MGLYQCHKHWRQVQKPLLQQSATLSAWSKRTPAQKTRLKTNMTFTSQAYDYIHDCTCAYMCVNSVWICRLFSVIWCCSSIDFIRNYHCLSVEWTWIIKYIPVQHWCNFVDIKCYNLARLYRMIAYLDKTITTTQTLVLQSLVIVSSIWSMSKCSLCTCT